MLHDQLMSDSTHAATTCDDRRRGDRVPFPAEIVLAWVHDLGSPVRYRVIDAGDGGFRIRTSTPLTEGMTGIALRILPEGKPIDRMVMVAWCAEADEAGERDIGLRYF